MDFDQYFVNHEDYKFFKDLSSEEKILFLYDLLFFENDDVDFTESLDSNDIESIYANNLPEMQQVSLDDMTDGLGDELHDMVANVIAEDKTDTTIIFINQFLVINSDSEKDLIDAAYDIVMDGHVLCEKQLTLKQLSIFHQRRYCKVYMIIGKIPKLFLN